MLQEETTGRVLSFSDNQRRKKFTIPKNARPEDWCAFRLKRLSSEMFAVVDTSYPVASGDYAAIQISDKVYLGRFEVKSDELCQLQDGEGRIETRPEEIIIVGLIHHFESRCGDEIRCDLVIT